MLTLIRRLSDNDGAVKALFDHLRNVGIAAAFFAAAAWKSAHVASDYTRHFDYVVVVLLCLFGSFLFFLNQAHGVRKLQAASASSSVPSWVLTFVMLTYSAVIVSFVTSLVIARL